MTPLESLVIEWTAAHMTIANECLRTQGKGLVVTPEMVIRLRNAERSLLDFARNISPVTDQSLLPTHPLIYHSPILKTHIEQSNQPISKTERRSSKRSEIVKATGPSSTRPLAPETGGSP